jgi:hypothetical protein
MKLHLDTTKSYPTHHAPIEILPFLHADESEKEREADTQGRAD